VTSDPVVLALRAAIAANDSAELRVALGEHLLRSGEPREALVEIEAGLRLSPGSAPLLDAAARAADSAGDPGRAAVYRLAATAIAGSPGTTSAPSAPPAPAPGGDDVAGDREGGVDEEGSADPTHPARAGRIAGGPNLRLLSGDGEPIEDDAPPALSFADVGGMDDLKARLERSFLGPLRDPETYRRFGKKIGGGIVLYGPPGCGKTFLARALAGEIGARFTEVGLSQVLDMWFGESEKRLHELFENARRRAPTVLFFDEVDALGARRTDMRSASNRHVINQFLSELDGVKASNEGILVLAATNAPWHLDSAFRRPGRFDRVLFVPPPDQAARAAILRILCRDKPAEALDYGFLAAKTDGFSGADLKAVVDRCIEDKLREAMRAGSVRPVTTRDLAKAIKAVKPSTREWFSTARNYAVHANEAGIYDDVLRYLER
jgi:AAA+ superfamily predicted ATPase